ncbi:hypothetical protein ACTXL0_07050 [Psychrobacter faecalis]|uniref:hypothetical protein n=1 Tax=Psychrobacter faecalis TaxID=180588 RepID=UPI003FD10120
MTTFHLKLEEAEIERLAVIGGDADNPQSGRILISGYIKDLLGYDFITDDVSSEKRPANYLEISIHATEDESRLAQRELLLIHDSELHVITYVNSSYFNYILSLISDDSLRVSVRMDVLLTEEEAEKTFWGLSKTRELGFEHVKIDESCKDFEIIKSGIEIDSKCERVMPTLIMKSSKTITEEHVTPKPVVKQTTLSDTLPPKEQPANRNILIVIALLLFFILLKV